jgi:hypothetical protein
LTVGLNPSTATRERSDTTVAKVEETARRHGYDGFVMLNLLPIRATDWKELPSRPSPAASARNLREIVALVATLERPTLWAAWGATVLSRPFFAAAAVKLIAALRPLAPEWLRFGALTAGGHPRHPSRLDYRWRFAPFDAEGYLRILSK